MTNDPSESQPCPQPAGLGCNEGLGPLPLPQAVALANEVMDDMVRNSLRFRWLQDEATAEQWERASHALDAGAEIDAMMVCR